MAFGGRKYDVPRAQPHIRVTLEGVLPQGGVEAKRQYPEPMGRRGGGARRRERDPRRLMTPEGVGGFTKLFWVLGEATTKKAATRDLCIP